MIKDTGGPAFPERHFDLADNEHGGLAQPEPAPGYCQHCKQYTIEEPLPAQPEQEPVAHVDHRIHGWPDCFVMEAEPPHTSPLYTTPPRREWVGLTEEEVDECYYWKGRQWTTDELVRHVEAKLREKNHQ